MSDITRRRLRKVFELIPGSDASGLRCLTLAPSNFIQHDLKTKEEQNLLFSKTLASELNVEDIAAEILLKNGVKLDAPWKRQAIRSLKLIIADNVAIVIGLELDEDSVKEILEIYGD